MSIKKKSSKTRTSLLQRLKPHNWHRHPFFIPVTTFVVLFMASLVGFVVFNQRPVIASDTHIIVLSHDKKRVTVPTRAQTVGEFLERSGITLNEGDVVEPARETEILEDNFRVNVYRARPVTIIDGDRKLSAFSAATTARSVAEQSGVTLYAEDNIKSQMQDKFLSDSSIGEKVLIERAVPTTLNLYGTAVPVRTHAKTVGELLKEKNVTLAKDDSVQPAVETPLAQAVQVFVVRSGTKVATVEEPIAMEVETIQDPSLSFGASAIRQKGTPGKKLVTYQIDLKNDKEISRRIIQEVTVQQPVKQIVAKGKAVSVPTDKEAIMAAAGISPSDYGYVNYIISRESGWRITASNPSGAYGLCQALPGSKMASAGADWQTNPVTQLKWCSGYAKSRYGSWQKAYEVWTVKHWW